MSVLEIWSCYGFHNKRGHSRVSRRCSLWLLLQRAATKFLLCLQTWGSHVCKDVSLREPTHWFPLRCLLLNKEAAWFRKPVSLLGIFWKYLSNASKFTLNRSGYTAWFEAEEGRRVATYGRNLWIPVCICYKLTRCKFLSQVPSSGGKQREAFALNVLGVRIMFLHDVGFITVGKIWGWLNTGTTSLPALGRTVTGCTKHHTNWNGDVGCKAIIVQSALQCSIVLFQ